MIGVIAPYVARIRRSYQSNDIIDRLNYQYTAIIITLAAFTLAATQYVGKPIQCWVPAQFTGAWEKYTETYCFIKGSYFLPFDDDIPYEYSPRDDAVIGYYQWVPIMLAFQAFLFYFPSLVWKALNFRTDCGDMIDRLNYHYTAIILVITGLSIAGMLYAKHPVQCWVPAEFIPQWEHYAEVYCFTNGFYHVAERCDPETTESDEICLEDKSIYVGYYQWLPLIALLQAFMFAVPLYLWRINAGKSGINVRGVLNSAALVKKKFDRGSRTAQVHTAADHLQEALEMQRELKSGTYDFLHFGKRSGIYLIGLYLFTKLLYVVNVVMQFVILNAFLGPQYTFWGAGILADIWNGKEWNESGHFPRVTMCDFNVRVLGNIHRWTVQCVLMINMFNEKIYIFLWWWFVLVGVLSVLSLMYYLIALTVSTYQREFVSRYLRCMGAIPEQWNIRDERYLNDFIKKFLRPDGVFLLRLIQTNGGDLLVGEIVTALFNRYRARVEDKISTLAVTESPDSSSSLHRRQ